MSSKPLEISVRPRGKPIKKLPENTYVREEDTAEDLYLHIAAKSRFSVHRLRITKGSDGTAIPNKRDVSIESVGLFDQSSIFVKDLGPQIAWQTVFLIEYFGPILIHPSIYFLRPYIYIAPNPSGGYPSPSFSQTLSLTLIVTHFIKRELETLFVHRFSAATMPAFNIFKNSAHYWLLAGLNIALFTYSPSPSCPTAHAVSEAIAYTAIALFVIGELGNLSAHLTLMGLRNKGGKERGIPTTGVFSFVPVTCPNYFFEAIAWAGIWLSNRSLSTGVFVVIALGQMAIWARKKERNYRKEFGGRYKKKTFAMIPGIV
ncbi:MAG: 3-oxo-5a-steroid 4- dehydrogenase [Chrysothrix sp. TS-e1954]|nr:MAG: 3-oxo-5a-steroid 4- dehydrogenase [Chrysothrix sp. TS-e1954]